MPQYVKKGYARGSTHPATKLTSKQVIAIFQSTDKIEYIAATHNVSVRTVFNIKGRKTWAWLTHDIIASKFLRKGGMKQAFNNWIAGQHTVETFEEMCRAHDLTHAYSDDHSVWRMGTDEYKIIKTAASKLGMAISAPIWNRVCRLKISPTHVTQFLWSECAVDVANSENHMHAKTGSGLDKGA